MLDHLSVHWDGLLVITGDFDIDVPNSDATLPMQYTDILCIYDLPPVVTLSQHESQPSRKIQLITLLLIM